MEILKNSRGPPRIPLPSTHSQLSIVLPLISSKSCAFLYRNFPCALFSSPFTSPLCPIPLCSEMADQHRPAETGQPSKLLDNLFNKECTMCKAHTIMIDSHSDRNSKRKKLDKRKNEIETLQDRCSHLEAAMEHIRSLTQSYQAETSTKASARNPEDSITQHFP